VKRGLEQMKLKNLHCIEAVYEGMAGKGLAGAVVICELWR
jgi:hypothetical protein